ncbi:MAG: dTDP-glucose 4,6-dehydratase [Patescibacteria group bacterium]|nr:dTDP-glucose 4,6-dehydratase [Patescibacteria group bacterium]
MKILVTGGAGFIGSNFIHYWLQHHASDRVVNFDKLTYAGNLENLKAVEKNPHYQFVRGDIGDPEGVAKAMSGVDVVVHFAAESHVDRSILGATPFVLTNVVGTQVVLDAALKAKVQRFHHVSTDEVFGQLPLGSGEAFNEETPYNPRNPYSASKAGSDHLVRAYHATHGLPVTISNTANNYGPYQFPEKLIPLAITNLMEGKPVPVYGDGKYVRDWLYVTDHCRAIDLMLSKGKVGETYCIGGLTQDVNNLTLVKKIIALLGKDESAITFVKDRPGHDRRYAIDWSKAKRELGYQPKHSFDEYLESTVHWYQENQDWWQRVKSGAYQQYYREQYGNR